MALVKCRECGNGVSTTADACPKCGATVKKGIGRGKILVYGFFVLVAVQAAFNVGGRGKDVPPDLAPEPGSPVQNVSQGTARPSTSADKAGAVLVKANASPAAACDAASTQSGALKRVTGSDNVLRDSPKPDGAKLINKKATEAFKETHYLTIGQSVTVREECSKAGWSRVQVVEPSHLVDSHIGWVKSGVLRNQQKNANGTLVFTEEDIAWDKGTTPYKKIVVAGVNKVHQENPRCKIIDAGGVTKSSTKGSKADPVFFVPCDTGTASFNAFFSKSDVEKSVNLNGANLDGRQAVALCKAHVKNNANHPSTVDFSVQRLIEHPNGRTTVDASFSAKNSFNLELKYQVHCMVNKDGIMEAQVAEVR